MDAAAAAYVALSADGTDVLLMAADHTLRRELSRRIRDDLMQLGIVAAGPAVRIGDGAQASPGDLISCTRNDHTVQAGEPGRTLANGDLLRIEAVTRRGLIVRRALDADSRTGQRRWTDRTLCTRTTAMPSWVTRSPTTPPRAGPCTPAWPLSPGPRTASTPTSRCPAAPTSTSPTCSPRPRNGPTRRPARVLLPSWPAATRFIPNETAFVPRSPGLPRRARRWPCWLACWTATASSARPSRRALPAATIRRTRARGQRSAPELTMTAGEETRETGQGSGPAEAHRTFADRMADRLSLMIPSQHPDYGDLARRSRLGQDQARWLLRPAKPEIWPSRRSSSVRRTATPTSRPQIGRTGCVTLRVCVLAAVQVDRVELVHQVCQVPGASVVLVPSPGIRPAGMTARQRPADGGRITASGWASSNRAAGSPTPPPPSTARRSGRPVPVIPASPASAPGWPWPARPGWRW